MRSNRLDDEGKRRHRQWVTGGRSSRRGSPYCYLFSAIPVGVDCTNARQAQRSRWGRPPQRISLSVLTGQERTNRLLLMQLHANRQDDERAHTTAIRAWLEANHGRPRAVTDRRDPSQNALLDALGGAG